MFSTAFVSEKQELTTPPKLAEALREMVAKLDLASKTRARLAEEPDLHIRGTLEWVNAIRTEHGLRALPSLPRGWQNSGSDCVIARALRGVGDAVSVGRHKLVIRAANRSFDRHVPDIPRQFITRFDHGYYPQLSFGKEGKEGKVVVVT